MNSQSNEIPNVPSKRMASQMFDHGAYEYDIVESTADNSQKLPETSTKLVSYILFSHPENYLLLIDTGAIVIQGNFWKK